LVFILGLGKIVTDKTALGQKIRSNGFLSVKEFGASIRDLSSCVTFFLDLLKKAFVYCID